MAWVMDTSGMFLQLTYSKCQGHKNGMGIQWEGQLGHYSKKVAGGKHWSFFNGKRVSPGTKV